MYLFVIVASLIATPMDVTWRQVVHQEGNMEISGSSDYIEGTVIRGAGLAKLIDWPTANLQQDVGKKLSCGFYMADTSFGKAIVLAWPPSMVIEKGGVLEVHIIKFDRNIYGQRLGLWNVISAAKGGDLRTNFVDWYANNCML